MDMDTPFDGLFGGLWSGFLFLLIWIGLVVLVQRGLEKLKVKTLRPVLVGTLTLPIAFGVALMLGFV